MIDASNCEAVERDVAIERSIFRVHVLDGLEIVEVFRIDVGDNADLGREPHERAVALVCLDDHPLTFAKTRI